MTFTTDEIIAMAKEARVSEMGLNIDGSIHLLGLFERFAALVAAKEREACAQVAKVISDKYGFGYYGDEVDAADEIEAAIRARGTKEGA